jgi:hypothetical protein
VYKRWVQTRDLSTCTLYWNNQITNARGEAITTPVRFTPASPSCDVAAYNNLSTTVTNLINEMATSANYQQLALTHYDVTSLLLFHMLTFVTSCLNELICLIVKVNFKLLDENWYGCRSWVQNLTAVATLERELTNLYGCYKFPVRLFVIVCVDRLPLYCENERFLFYRILLSLPLIRAVTIGTLSSHRNTTELHRCYQSDILLFII